MIEQFLDYLRRERNRSELTLLRYEQSLRAFEQWFKAIDSRLEWRQVDADVIRRWVESLMDNQQAASTVNTSVSALRSFFRFAMMRGLVASNPARAVQAPRKQRPLPQFVKESEMDRLLDQGQWDDSYAHLRARTIIIMLYEAGLRRSELTGLNDGDVDVEHRQMRVTGKGRKERIIPFGQELADAVTRYREERDKQGPRQSEALFTGKSGKRITGEAVYKVVHEALSGVANLQKRSPHVLRHSYATALLNHDAGLESVRKLLGHESIETTEIYTHTTFEQLKRVYEKAHPRG